MIHHFEMVSGTCGLHALQGAPSACSRIVCLDQSQRSVCLRTRPSQWERCVKGRSILNRLASLRGKKASCSSGRSLIFRNGKRNSGWMRSAALWTSCPCSSASWAPTWSRTCSFSIFAGSSRWGSSFVMRKKAQPSNRKSLGAGVNQREWGGTPWEGGGCSDNLRP